MIFKRKPFAAPAHVLSLWNNDGTGHGDEMDGWRCTCGANGLHTAGATEHTDAVNLIEALNLSLRLAACPDGF